MTSRWWKLFLGVYILLFIVRIVFISTTMVIDDEAYYFIYSRHPAGGYIDHGPVIAFLIRLFTLIFGENGFGIRIGAVLLLSALGIILYSFGKLYFNTITGVVLALTVISNVLFHTNGVVATPDAPMAFFTILTVLYYYRAYFHNKKYFYHGGFFLGLSLLSKISAIFPALGIILFPVFVKTGREILKEKRFYVSLLIAFLVFLPFIIWNVRNDFAFVRYQGAHVMATGGVGKFFELWSALALLLGPVLFYYAVYLPIKYLFRLRNTSNVKNVELVYFSMVSVIPLIYFSFHSLISRFEVNWPAPAFFGGLILFGIYIGEQWKTRKNVFRFQILYSLALIIIITVQTYYPFLPLKGKSDITNRYYAFQCFPGELKRFLETDPRVQGYRIIANNYQIPSMINLYVNPVQEATCLSIGYHETLYSFLYPDSSLRGQDYIFVGKGKQFPGSLKPYFDKITLLRSFSSLRNEYTVTNYNVWLVSNYHGKANSFTGK